MTTHRVNIDHLATRPDLGGLGPAVMRLGLIVGVVGLAAALLLSFGQWRMFGLGYLSGFAYWWSLSMGALFFVLIQHLTRAGWSVTVRRIAELMAANLMYVAILALPILVLLGVIYEPWIHPDHALKWGKAIWLSVPFFLIRLALYIAVWLAVSRWYLKLSLRQDETGDRQATRMMQGWVGGALVLFVITGSFAGFDLFMSLTPHWYSTIWSVYLFAGGMCGFFAALVVILRGLGRAGLLNDMVTTEHYHDLGKWLFGFVFFWGYIAFSQYMLIWYGTIPEEQSWLAARGASTNPQATNAAWSSVTLLLLFGHFLIPFPALLSRHVKRVRWTLLASGVWLMVFHWVDIVWLIVPNLEIDGSIVRPILTASCCWVGVGGLWIAGLAHLAGGRCLVPIRDPRFNEALVFENV